VRRQGALDRVVRRIKLNYLVSSLFVCLYYEKNEVDGQKMFKKIDQRIFVRFSFVKIYRSTRNKEKFTKCGENYYLIALYSII